MSQIITPAQCMLAASCASLTESDLGTINRVTLGSLPSEIQYGILSISESAFSNAFFPVTLLEEGESLFKTQFAEYVVGSMPQLMTEVEIEKYCFFDNMSHAAASTRIRLQHEAVTKLLGEQPLYAIEENGALIAPYIKNKTMLYSEINISNGLTSIGDSILKMLRCMADEMFMKSGLKAFLRCNRKAYPETPEIIIGTSPVISRAIRNSSIALTTGAIDDQGLVGVSCAGLKIKLVSTLDTRVKNKAFVTFKFQDKAPNVPHGLTFGHTVWAMPEINTIYNRKKGLVRNTFTPRAAIVTHLPVLTTIDFDPQIESKIYGRM